MYLNHFDSPYLCHSRAPETASMKSKMIATSTCESLKRKLDARLFQCNDADDMSVDAVKEKIEKFSANR